MTLNSLQRTCDRPPSRLVCTHLFILRATKHGVHGRVVSRSAVDSLGVVIYNDRDDPLGPGAIEFWNVVRDGPEPRLERTRVRVDVVRGPHAMNFIP